MGTTDKVGSSGEQTAEPFPGFPRDMSSPQATPPGERRAAATDRRVRYDRREMIRFEEDRRSGADRRAGNGDPWALRLSPA